MAAHRRKEASVLSPGGGGHPLTTRRQVHRDPGHLRSDDRAGQAQPGRGKDQGLAEEGGAPVRHGPGLPHRPGSAAEGIGEEAAHQAVQGRSRCRGGEGRRIRGKRTGGHCRPNARSVTVHDYTDLVSYIIKAMVTKPDEVKVAMVEGERTNRVEVTLANDDVGKVIGRGGPTIDAIRAVVRAAAPDSPDRGRVETV